MLKNTKLITAALLAACIIPKSYGYSTLVFEISNKAGDKVEKKVSIDGRWLRIDSTPKGKADYTLMDTGFHKQYDVYDNEKSFQLTYFGRLYWPETPLLSPKFKPLRKNAAFAGARCQQVNELGKDKQPVAEHCMATGGSLGLNDREMMTLSRLFMSIRRMNGTLEKSWIGVATPDERQISIHSGDFAGNSLVLKSVSHEKLDYRLLKIPVEYKALKPELPVGGIDHTDIPDPPNYKRAVPEKNNK